MRHLVDALERTEELFADQIRKVPWHRRRTLGGALPRSGYWQHPKRLEQPRQVERRNHLVTVIVPEFVPTKRWHNLLHGNSGLLLKLALLGRRNIIVTNVRYYLEESEAPPPRDALAEEIAPLEPVAHREGGNTHGH